MASPLCTNDNALVGRASNGAGVGLFAHEAVLQLQLLHGRGALLPEKTLDALHVKDSALPDGPRRFLDGAPVAHEVRCGLP